MKPEATYYIEDGELRHAGDETPIESPAVLLCLDGATGIATVLRCGEAGELRAELKSKSPAYASAGLGTLSLVEIGRDAGLEAQCYILRRCLEFSASPFPAELARRIGDGTVGTWLAQEMERVPLG